jgi:predicted N-acetyltransferase YhbS
MTTRLTTIAYRPMRDTDLPAAHALSQAVRWPHRAEDWQFALRLGPGFVAEEDGAVVGTALCWHQGPHHGSLGLIIVSPAHQGKGIGSQLMRLVLERLGDRCTLLNATRAGQPLYESLGFQAIGTLHQHQGIFAPPAASTGPSARPATAADIPAIVALANRATGMVRDEVIEQLVGVAGGAVVERDGAVTGF